MTLLVIDCGSLKTKDISNSFLKIGADNYIVDMDSLDSVDFSFFEGFIISGSPILLTEIVTNTSVLERQRKYKKMFEFVNKIDKPILGICFGHQIIGIVHGSDVYRGQEIRREEKIEIVQEDIIFRGFDDSVSFIEDHCEGIILPEDFVRLAKSSSYGNEAMKHKDKNIYGVQFHPEASGSHGLRFLKNFYDICINA